MTPLESWILEVAWELQCHYTMLSVVCSLVFYFVIGVVAVVAIVVTGVVLIAAVPILICTLIVTYCVCKVMEKS